ncbi:hypothetical protein GOBAR_DD33814 [Gossypium barbadense]|nr:hypothetical protein GOBAR_DD33814 [Gossypium barbadense]
MPLWMTRKRKEKEAGEVLEELALVDIKPSRGWFTWVNNRDDANVIRQTKSDHDAVLLDTMGKKPKEKRRDPRPSFRLRVGQMTRGLRRLSRIVGVIEAIILWRKLMGFVRFWGHGSLTNKIE